MKLRVGKGVLNGNQFIEVHNNGPVGSPQVDTAAMRFLESIKKDSHLNGFNPEASTLSVPRFTHDIISCLPPISQQQSSKSSTLSPCSHGSCAFDLAHSLNLLPSQEYGVLLGNAMVEVEIDKVGRYNDRYCGFFSRHGLVLLASRYADRVSMVGGMGGSLVIETTLGRFKVFEHNHMTYVHFNPGTRTAISTVDQRLQLLPDMDVIRKAATGQYLAKDVYADFEEIPTTQSDWRHPVSVSTMKIAITSIIENLECRVFLRQDLVKDWEQVSQFSSDMLMAVTKIFFTIQEPRRLVQIRDYVSDGITRQDPSLVAPDEEVERMVANCGCVFKGGSFMVTHLIERGTMAAQHSFMKMITNLWLGHQKIRAQGRTVDIIKLSDTSDKRFLALFEEYKTHQCSDRLEEELRKLLHINENICLVLWQGALALIALSNASKVFEYGIASPDEWIQFLLAQDSDILIG